MMSFEEMAALDAFLIKRIQDAQEEFKRTDQQVGQMAFGWMKSPKNSALPITSTSARLSD